MLRITRATNDWFTVEWAGRTVTVDRRNRLDTTVGELVGARIPLKEIGTALTVVGSSSPRTTAQMMNVDYFTLLAKGG